MRGKIFKQHNLGQKIGAINTLFGKTMFYVSMVNFGFMMITVYEVSLRNYIRQYAPWFSFPLFFGVVIIGFFVVMILVYKFVLPSDIRFSNAQSYANDSPVKYDFIEVKQQLTKIEAILQELKGG